MLIIEPFIRTAGYGITELTVRTNGFVIERRYVKKVMTIRNTITEISMNRIVGNDLRVEIEASSFNSVFSIFIIIRDRLEERIIKEVIPPLGWIRDL